MVKVDKIIILEGSNRCQIAVTLHCGRYRIVRRIFEHFGYQVDLLDRPIYGCLTKQGIKPGGWRFLTVQEIAALQEESTTYPKPKPIKQNRNYSTSDPKLIDRCPSV